MESFNKTIIIQYVILIPKNRNTIQTPIKHSTAVDNFLSLENFQPN